MPRPLNVILDLTARCNLKCVMCYFAEHRPARLPAVRQTALGRRKHARRGVRKDRRGPVPEGLARRARLRRGADDPPEVQGDRRDRRPLRRSGPLVPDEPARPDRLHGRGPGPRARRDGRGLDRRDDEGVIREDPGAGEVGAAPRLSRDAADRVRSAAKSKTPRLRDHLHLDAVESRGPRAPARVRGGPGRLRHRRPVRVPDAGRRRVEGAPLRRRPAGVERRALGRGA